MKPHVQRTAQSVAIYISPAQARELLSLLEVSRNDESEFFSGFVAGLDTAVNDAFFNAADELRARAYECPEGWDRTRMFGLADELARKSLADARRRLGRLSAEALTKVPTSVLGLLKPAPF